MQTQNELKDILLDSKEDDVRGVKLKKLLVAIAALSILFLIVIATMKILNTDDMEVINTEDDTRLALPPMPDEASSVTSIVKDDSNKKQNDQLFEQVPILSESKAQDEFEEMVKKLKEKEAPKQEAEQPKPESKPVVAQVTPKVEAPKAEAPKQEAPKPESKPAQQPKAEPKKEPAKPAAQAPRQAAQQASQSDTVAPGAYVQVSAPSKIDPSSAELRKILAKGYTYKALKVGNGYKILIGPYDSANLQRELANIRKEIKQDAFIYRVK